MKGQGIWDINYTFPIKYRGPDPHGLKKAVITDPFDNFDVRNIDRALKQVLRKFAIDPDKIGLIGSSSGGTYSLFLGRHNLDVFHRIAALSATANWGGNEKRDTATQFYISSGITEGYGMYDQVMLQVILRAAQELRQEGHAVRLYLAMRGHRRSPRQADRVWRWFQESWATAPTPAVRQIVADSMPLLTTEALTRMATFWGGLIWLPDSVKDATFAEANLMEVALPIGQRRVPLIDVDMPAVAAKDSSIKVELAKAGLTARAEEAYRLALISAFVTEGLGSETAGVVAATSVLGQNAVFVRAHQQEVERLTGTGMIAADPWDR